MVLMITTTITKKGQVTIPISVRKALGVKPRDRVVFLPKGKDFIVRPTINFLSLRGSIKSRKKFDIKAMEKAAEEQAVSGFLKK